MKSACCIVILIACCISLAAFMSRQHKSPREKIIDYYRNQFGHLQQTLTKLGTAVEEGNDSNRVREDFLQARLAYKQLELILEYYFEGDVKYFNGLAVPFIEEEDPAAHQEPQGLQVIETFLYPVYNQNKKEELLTYIKKIERVAEGLGNNYALFVPRDYIPDAIMEELYRVLALGITGFDSPLAKRSLEEAGAALCSIAAVMDLYSEEWRPLQPLAYANASQLLQQARIYLKANTVFDSFNRMEFILSFLNPLCETFARIKAATGNRENRMHYTVIKKIGSLFNRNNLDTNRYQYDASLNKPEAALGRALFYEPLLSVNGKRSCASCHRPGKAFTDGFSKALQLDGHSTLPRNTPVLWNASLQMNLFYDSRHVLLQDVVLEVLSNKKEMNSGAGEAVKKLEQSAKYRKLFRQVYKGTSNGITEKNISASIAMYLRTLISYNARFDKYMRGRQQAMNADEIKGFNLFAGKARCATCHYIPLFNGSRPPTYYYQESEVLGVPSTPDTLHPQLDKDPGRIAFLKKEFLAHSFKTPTLRNIALTAPYMHNGVYKTLEEVIDFYDRGGGQGLGIAVPNQTLPAERLQLTTKEKHQLKAFLLTLTDTAAIH
jgi:cytochrome c peroxidase